MGLFSKLFGGKKIERVEPSESIDFTFSDQLMDEDKFWQIIQLTKEKAKNDFEKQQEELAKQLRKLTPSDIIFFGNRFRFFRGEANTWEVWGAIYIILGGCGDDSFNDFREWIIGQGKEFYYKTIKDPETLVDVEKELIEETEWEGLGYVPDTIFEEITGQDLVHSFQENFETAGNEWKEEGDDLKKMFPKLYAKYPVNI